MTWSHARAGGSGWDLIGGIGWELNEGGIARDGGKDGSLKISHKTNINCRAAAEWSSGRIPACCTGGRGFKPQVGSPRIFNIGFHQQKLCSLSIACDIKLESLPCTQYSKLRQGKDPGHH